MIYFFINIIMYLILILLLIRYFRNKANVTSFMLILFNMNVYFMFIYQDINFVYGIIVLIISLILYSFFMLFNKQNKEVILIKDGNINFHELIENYSYRSLINYLKFRHLKLDEIAYLIKNSNGLTVIKNKQIDGLPVSLIVDGNLMEENLKIIHKKKEWLQEELLKNHLLIKNVDYAYYKKGQVYFVSSNNVKFA